MSSTPSSIAAASVLQAVAARSPAYTELNDRVWDYAELAFYETRSAADQVALLAQEGFRISRGLGGIDTAFSAEWGEGGPLIGILGEFDALAGLSQVAGGLEPRAAVAGGAGHGCGHNLLGSASALAAASLAEALRRSGLPGRIRYYGCPAEECGGGKAFMAREGAFDELDAALTWHPASLTAMNFANNLAFRQASFRFTGKASHAGISPHLGRSALDAAELMNVGVNFLREHVIPDARIHYAFRDAGGQAPNVVQASAELVYVVRAPTVGQLLPIYDRIEKIAQGAALMTETTLQARIESGMSDILLNRTLAELLHGQLQALEPIAFSAGDREAAADYVRTFTRDEIDLALHRVGAPAEVTQDPLHPGVVAFDGSTRRTFGSTDVGDVSWVTPTAQFWGAAYAVGTSFHTWQMVAQGKLPAAHKGMAQAARALALAALRLLTEPELLRKARDEFDQRRNGQGYRCPVPADVFPPTQEARVPLQAKCCVDDRVH